jgi:uncharacterized protein YejL (UPF0352 family)
MRTTIGDLITELVEVYEREYADHELATVKTALIVDDLLRANVARAPGTRSARSLRAAWPARSRRAVRGAARKAA